MCVVNRIRWKKKTAYIQSEVVARLGVLGNLSTTLLQSYTVIARDDIRPSSIASQSVKRVYFNGKCVFCIHFIKLEKLHFFFNLYFHSAIYFSISHISQCNHAFAICY